MTKEYTPWDNIREKAPKPPIIPGGFTIADLAEQMEGF